MRELLDLSFFKRENWIEYLNVHIYANNDFFQVSINDIPKILHLVPILQYFGYKTQLLDLLNVLKIKITDTLILKSYLDFIEFFITASETLNRDIVNKIEIWKQNSVYSHQWYKECFFWLLLDFEYRCGADLPPHLKTEIEYFECDYIWWYWQINYIYTMYAFRSGNHSKASFFITKMDLLIQEKHLQILEAYLYNVKSIFALLNGSIEEAIGYLEQASLLAEQYHINQIIPNIKNNLGLMYTQLGDYKSAIQHFQRSIELHTSLINKTEAILNIGFTFYFKGAMEEAIVEFKHAEAILKDIPQDHHIQGVLFLCLGIVEALHGKIDEALPLFNKAQKSFLKYNDIPMQIYLYGIIGQIFYDHNELDLAELYFQKFKTLLNQVKSYEMYFQFYCVFIQLLLDQKRLSEAKLELDQLQFVASKHSKSRVLRAWFNFATAMYERDRLNFSNLEQLLLDVLNQTIDKGPFNLALRALITLSELNLRKYLMGGDEQYLEKVESLLIQANEYGNANPVYPTIIYVKLYNAMLGVYKKDWKQTDKVILEIEEYINTHILFSSKSIFTNFIDQIKSQKIFAGDISFSLMNSFVFGIGRQIQSLHFANDEIGLVIWRFSNSGPEPAFWLISYSMIPENLIKLTLVFMGSMYATMLGQGDYYHEGVYGPLPIPVQNIVLHCMIYTKRVNDQLQIDTRLKKTNYMIIGLIYRGNLDINRHILEDVINKWWSNISDLSLLTFESFEDLKKRLLAEPIKFTLL